MITKFVGRTLSEIRGEVGTGSGQGIAVFQLQDDKDEVGKCIDEQYSLNLILQNYPELSELKVKYANFFYGMWVFRVI